MSNLDLGDMENVSFSVRVDGYAYMPLGDRPEDWINIPFNINYKIINKIMKYYTRNPNL